MASTQQLQCTGRMPGKCHTKDSSWQTTSRGCPLPSEKTMAYRNSHVVRAASKLHVLEDCTTRTTANWITNIKQATTASKSRQGKTSRQRRHLSVGTTEGVPFSDNKTYAQCAVTTSDSITSSGGKQSSWFKSNWQAGTYKWCTRCAGRQEHSHDSSPRQKLKSLATQDIAESEWHEPIQSIRRKAVQRHTPCHRGLGSSIQAPSVKTLKHLAGTNVCKQTTDVSPHHSSGVIFKRNYLRCRVDSDLTSVPSYRTEISLGDVKHPQGNLWRSRNNHLKASQINCTSPRIKGGLQQVSIDDVMWATSMC